MTRLLILLPVLLWMSGCADDEVVNSPNIPDGPVEWSVSASSSSSEVQVGDDVVLTLTVMHPPEGDFVAPSQADFEPFAVVETWSEDASPVETRLHFRLAAYQLPEALEVAALSIRYRDDDGEMATLSTEPIAVNVVTSLTPDVVDIHDIKEPMALEIPRDWSLLLWLLLALVLAGLAYLIYRKFRKDVVDAAPVWVPRTRSPHEEAEAALARLAAKGLIESGEIELFYTELTDIMKRYAGRRFEVAYLERTTGEILSDLGAKDVSEGALRAILEVGDNVKFAKGQPGRDDACSSLSMAHRLVRDTRAVPVEASQ